MSYLVRFAGDTPHKIAHYTHKVKKRIGALCSSTPYPAVGEQSQKGEWHLVGALPTDVTICKNCERAKAKKENPLPPRVQRELDLLAKWDLKAAARQREQMMAKYKSSARGNGRFRRIGNCLQTSNHLLTIDVLEQLDLP